MDDRTPLVREEELMLDSGQLLCATEPAGATVLVNGIERGVTPVEVLVPRGGATLTFRLKGYQDVEQSVGMSAGERRQLTVKMDGLPARLTVVTEPEKAKVYLDGNFQGKSPVTVDAVKSGAHEIRAELPGYAIATRTVKVEAKETKQLPFTLRRDTTADTEVELIDGSRVSGLFKREDDEQVVLEIKSGVERPIPRANIRKVTSLRK